MNYKYSISLLFGGLLYLLLLPLSFATQATLHPHLLPANGTQHGLLRVYQYGRYSLRAKSTQGTALRLVDRMEGPGKLYGIPGQQDGRVDTFLEPGEYRIVTLGHKQAQGQVQLQIQAFVEQNGPQAPRLPEFKRVDTELKDGQQRSYWLQVEKRRTLAIEAAGRNLSDIRLWRDGNWLVHASPQIATLTPATGQPLQVRRLVVNHLAPGLYLLTAYGGPEALWAKENHQHPLHLRYGIPIRGAAGRDTLQTSPFGIDRWRVPQQANFFRLELPHYGQAELRVERFDPKQPFGGRGRYQKITKKSRLPVAEITTASNRKGYYLVTVTQNQSKPFRLQHFQDSPRTYLAGAGKYWLGVISSAYGGDEIDTTAMFTERQPTTKGLREHLKAAAAVVIDKSHGWQGRFTLQGPLTLFLEVKQTAEYRVIGQGPSVGYRIEPFLTYKPKGYQAPSFQSSGYSWWLDPGWYELTINPLPGAKGLLTLAIQPPEAGAVSETVTRTATFGEVDLANDRDYVLYLNQRPGIRFGGVLRSIPVDLSTPLPVDQRASYTRQIPISIPSKGRLYALDEEGEYLPIALDELAWETQATVTSGLHTIHIHNPKNRPIQYSLRFEPAHLATKAALPSLSKKRRNQAPHFEKLGLAQPNFLDIGRKEQRNFSIQLNQPGLYRLESSGLLQVEGWLRTRTRPQLVRRKANGVGRNFLIQHFLDRGEYQLSLAALGQSKGHLGLHLQTASLQQGGVLQPDQPARRHLPAHHGMRYQFHITTPGLYRLQVLGPGIKRLIRLEDAQNWPITNVDQKGDFTQEFAVGTYTLLILPSALPGPVLTHLAWLPPARKQVGHGPHLVTIDQPLQHRWQEPSDPDQIRKPDLWQFKLPAPAEIRIQLDQDMEGLLYAKGKPTLLGRSTPAMPWKGRLALGEYRLETRNLRKNHGVSYQLAISSQQLLAGLTRKFTAPTELPLSVGRAGLVLLDSLSSEDLKADLYDAKGTLLASNDDRPDDWNFQIGRYLTPGQYNLHIHPVGKKTAQGTLSMRQPKEKYHSPLENNAQRDLAGEQVQRYPILASTREDVLLITTQTSEPIGVSLERQQGDAYFQLSSTSFGRTTHPSHTAYRKWDTLLEKSGREILLAYTRQPLQRFSNEKKSSFAIPDNYRLRIWPQNGALSSGTLRVHSFAAQRVSEQVFTGPGLTINSSKQKEPIILAVELERPGTFALPKNNKILWSSGFNRLFAPVPDGLLGVSGKTLWFMVPQSYQGTLRGSRVQLGSTNQKTLTLALTVRHPAFASSLQTNRGFVPAAARIDLYRENNGPLLAVLTSDYTQPGVAFVPSQTKHPMQPGADQAVAKTSAIAVRLQPGANPALRLWNNRHPLQAAQVKIQRHDFAAPLVNTSLDWGTHDLPLAAGKAHYFILPSGTKQLHLTLPAQVAAVFQQKETLLATHWAGHIASVADFELDADGVWILSTSAQTASASLEIIPTTTATSTLPPGQLFQRYFPTAGIQYLSFPAQSKVHLRGATQKILGQNGYRWMEVTQDFASSKGGLLRVTHGKGWLVAWSDTDKNKLFPWSTKEREQAQKIHPPTQYPLTSTPNVLLLQQAEPVLLGLSSHAPMLLQMALKGQKLSPVHFITPTHAFHIPVPAGTMAMTLRPLQVDGIDSLVTLTSALPQNIGEGLAAEVQLAPKDVRFYQFTLTQKGQIGIGVRADNDLAKTRLFNQQGVLLGEGLLQMPTLLAGTYFLELQAMGTAPVRMQIALAGLETPSTSPPEEILRHYLPHLP